MCLPSLPPRCCCCRCLSINHSDRIYHFRWYIECMEEMTSPGCIIVAHTRTFTQVYSFIGTSRKQIDSWAAQEDGETDNERNGGTETDRQREFCINLECASLHREKRKSTKRERERRWDARIAQKETAPLSLMRKNSENNNAHRHTHTNKRCIGERFRKNKHAESC